MAGLRERKKERTRRTIQEEALKLFATQGYEATTIDQIAEAADISPSTFFRYFATKEDVVLQDDYDPMLLQMFLDQPPQLSPIAALRKTVHDMFERLYDEDKAELLLRSKLQLSTPALRARMMATQISTVNAVAQAIAQRTGRDEDDLEVQAFAGAVIGALMPAIMRWTESDGKAPLPELTDICLAPLESGFALE